MPHLIIRSLGLGCTLVGCAILGFGCAQQPTHCLTAARPSENVPYAPPPKPLASTLHYEAGVAHFDEHPVGAAVEVGGYQPAFVRSSARAAAEPAKRQDQNAPVKDRGLKASTSVEDGSLVLEEKK